MRIVIVTVAVACLCGPALAQDADQAAATPQPPVTHEFPKQPTVLDKFDLKTTDSGTKVQQRLELDLPNSKDTFIFGDKTTTYPTDRNPGQVYQPVVPGVPPQNTYSIGIGRRF